MHHNRFFEIIVKNVIMISRTWLPTKNPKPLPTAHENWRVHDSLTRTIWCEQTWCEQLDAKTTWREDDLTQRRFDAKRVKGSRGRQLGKRRGSGEVGVTIRDPNPSNPNPILPTPTLPTPTLRPQPFRPPPFLTRRPQYTRFASNRLRVKSLASVCSRQIILLWKLDRVSML